jgi:hypothetical protein
VPCAWRSRRDYGSSERARNPHAGLEPRLIHGNGVLMRHPVPSGARSIPQACPACPRGSTLP